MNLKHTLIAFAGMTVMSIAASANASALGVAGDYNVMVFNDFSSANSDTEGNLAAGGNVTLGNYSVASHISGSDGARLVAGGSVTASNGGVGSGQNGSIYANSTTLSGFTANGGVHAQNQVNFNGLQSEYQNLSTSWSQLSANGTVNNSYGTLTLTGTDSALNVFSLDASQITNTNSVYINATAGSTVLINVSGNNQYFQNGQVFLSGINPSNVIYNLYQASFMSLVGSKNPQGSILAAFADVTGGYGQMNGQLIANSYNGNTEFHNALFTGDIPPVSAVPLPPAIWLFAPAVGLLGWIRRKNQVAIS